MKTTLGHLGQYINGVAFKPEDWSESGTPIIRIQNLTNPERPMNRTARQVDESYLVQRGDILVSWSATLDAFIWDREPAWVNQHIFKVIPDERVAQKRYLYYLLKQAISDMVKSEHLHGSTMKHINRGPFLAHDVQVPTLDDQRAIVDHLDLQFSRLDAAVEALKRAQANLKRYRASVLKAACEGRLVPTEADLARLRSPLLSLPREEGVGGGEGLVDPTDHPANKPTDQPTNPPTRQPANKPTRQHSRMVTPSSPGSSKNAAAPGRERANTKNPPPPTRPTCLNCRKAGPGRRSSNWLY